MQPHQTFFATSLSKKNCHVTLVKNILPCHFFLSSHPPKCCPQNILPPTSKLFGSPYPKVFCHATPINFCHPTPKITLHPIPPEIFSTPSPFFTTPAPKIFCHTPLKIFCHATSKNVLPPTPKFVCHPTIKILPLYPQKPLPPHPQEVFCKPSQIFLLNPLPTAGSLNYNSMSLLQFQRGDLNKLSASKRTHNNGRINL